MSFCRDRREGCVTDYLGGGDARILNKGSWSKWALLPLRLVIGYGFMAHGFAKLSRGPEGFAGILQTIGAPAPGLMAWSTALVEFFGGLAIIAGALVAIVSIPLAITMLWRCLRSTCPTDFPPSSSWG